MYSEVANWIDSLPLQDVSEAVVAFCFNLYDECDDRSWSMELIGAGSFDLENEDWACDEITDFGSRDCLFQWTKEANWENVLGDMVSVLREYLQKGKFADQLKGKSGVGVGFTDGNLEIICM